MQYKLSHSAWYKKSVRSVRAATPNLCPRRIVHDALGSKEGPGLSLEKKL
jgi:hypothetical protein